MLKRTSLFISKNLLLLFLLVVTGISCWRMLGKMQGEKWRYTVYMDGAGYYAQLPAYFIFNDPGYKFYAGESALAPDEASFLNESRNGQKINKYFCGEAFLLSPFFGAAHLVAKAGGYKTNGYSAPYFYAVAIAAIFYFLLGLFCSWRLLETWKFRKRVILTVCTCFAFGTNLFHYAIYEPSMSHVYSFAAVSAFLYVMRCFFLSPSRGKFLLCAFIFGTVLVLRPVNAVVFFAFPVMAGNVENIRMAFRWLMKHMLLLVPAFAIIFLLCFIQLYMYHWATGKFFVYAYGDEGFDFIHPHFHATLFSFEKGLFVYTPMVGFAVFGLIAVFRYSKFIFFSLAFLMVAIAWIVSAWHEYKYGYSFGLRAYIDYYALFALSMAFLVDLVFRKKIVTTAALGVFALVISLYQFQQYQFVHSIIHPGAMNEEAYWKVFLKTGKVYEGMISEENRMTQKESTAGFNDMEGNVYWPGMETVVNTIAHSGSRSSKIDSSGIYSCYYMKYMPGNEIFNDSVQVDVDAFIYYADDNSSSGLQVIEAVDETLYYMREFPIHGIPQRSWTKFHKTFVAPGIIARDEMIKIFFSRNSGTVYIDDFGVTIRPK